MRRLVSLMGLLLTAAVPVCAQPGSVLRNASVGVVTHVALSPIPASARIVFHTNQVVYTMDEAGGNITQITFNQGRALDHVAVSPDRLRVVASYQVSGIDHLVLFDLVAGTEQELLPHFYAAGAGGVDWDLAGNIYFAGVETLPYPNPVGSAQLIANAAAYDIYRVKYDGTGTLRITNTSDHGESDVSVSADGTLIAYEATHLDSAHNDPTELWINTVLGTKPQRVYEEASPATRSVHDPELSPDNTKLVFSRVNPAFHNFPAGANTAHDLYTIKTDGTALTLITVPGPISIIPDWKGNSIVYLELSDEAVDYLGVSTISDTGTGKVRINGNANVPKWIETASVPAVPAPAPPGPTPATLRVEKISWSIDANPANDPAIVTAAAYRANTAGQIAAYAKAMQAGVDHLQLVVKWNEVEAALGVYDFAKIDTLVANSGALPLVLNIAPIWDDGNTVLPGGLAFGNFTDAAVVTAYQNMLTALQSHLKGRLYILIVGNEVDTYLTTASRRAQYAVFLTQIRAWARTLFGVNPFKVSTCVRSSVAATWSDWAGIDAATDLNCFTYYPTVPGSLDNFAPQIQNDLGAMTMNGPLMFQELGLSTTVTGSSDALQMAAAQVLSGLIALVANQPSRTISVVTWSGLEDLSAAVISSFGYSSGQLTAGIGLRTTADAPKAAYTALCGFLGGTNCNAAPPPACTFSLAKASDTLTSAAGSGSVVLTTQTGCAWTLSVISGTPAWLTIGPASGTGTGTISYSLTANTDIGRSATAVVGGLNFSISQDGVQPPPPPPTCTFTLSKSGDTFTTASGNDTVVMTAADSTCPWTATVQAGATWLTLDQYSGTGNHTFTYSVTANTGTASRTGQFTTGDGDVMTIVQDGTEVPTPDPDPTPEVACPSTTASATGQTPLFGWTSCRQDTLNHEYADYLLNPSAPATMGGKWAKFIKDAADCNCKYYDIGQYDAIWYQMTGNTTYGHNSYNKLLTRMQALDTFQPNYNIVREEAIRWVWMLDWTAPATTTAQKDAAASSIARQLEYVINVGGLRVGDSDQTIGTYFGVVLMHLLRPTDTRITDLYNNPVIGGLVPTKASTAVLMNQDDITARNGIRRYVEVLAEGGEWIESAEYNMGTTRLLEEGYGFLKTATGGTNYFPEVSSWLQKWGNRLMATVTPDFLESYSWGDEEIPRYFRLIDWSSDIGETAGLLHGTATARRLQGLLQDLITNKGFVAMQPAANPAAGVMFVFYDPYETADDWKVNRSFFAKGVGLLSQRSGFATTDSVFFSSWAPRHRDTTGSDVGFIDFVDHHPYYLGDFTLWRNHEWVIDHPLNYGGPSVNGSEGVNGAMMHGSGSAEEYKADNLMASQSSTHAYIAGTTGGSLNAVATPPGVPGGAARIAIHEWTPERLYIPGTTDTIIAFDRANVTDLLDTDNYPHPLDSTFGFSTGLSQAAPNKKVWILHTPVSPTIAGNVVSWTTAGGQSVRWTALLPSAIATTLFDENAMANGTQTPCATWFGCGAWTNPVATERKFHVKVYPSVNQQFDTFLNVIQVGTQGVLVTKSNNGGIGVHATRPTQEDVLAIFNGTQGSNLTLPGYDVANHDIALDVVRFRGVGYTQSWTAVATSTLVFLEDLDPNASWTINLDGGGAVAIPACTVTPQTNCLTASGEYRTTVAGSGAHSFVLVGSGSLPPPPTCATIAIAPTSLGNGTLNIAYADTFVASGGTGPYTYTVLSGSLPPGLSVNPTTGAITGTPTSPGSYTFTIKGAQADLCFGNRTYTLVIDAVATTAIARTGAGLAFSNVSGTANSISVQATMGSGSNRLAAVELVGSTTDTFTSCTYNGVAMTLIDKIRQPNDLYLYGLRLVAPATGAHTLTCSFSANTAMAGLFTGYVGVDQTTPVQVVSGSVTYSSTATTTITAALTPTTSNAWTVLMGRSWSKLTAGLGSTLNVAYDPTGIALFDAGPHATANVARTMEATIAAAYPAAALMFILNAAP